MKIEGTTAVLRVSGDYRPAPCSAPMPTRERAHTVTP